MVDGLVSSNWKTFALGDIFDFSNGVNADKSAYGDGIPFVNVRDIVERESLTEDTILGRITLSTSMVKRYQVRYGDVLLNRTSETQDEVGLASVYLGSSPVVFGGFVFRARPKVDYLDANYSRYALRAHAVREQIIARGQGGIRSNIGQRDLRTVRVLVPPLGEQRAIAEALSDVDELIATVQRMIAKKKEMKQGMMRQLLPGKARLSGFRKPWREVRLGDFASLESGGTPTVGVRSYYGGGIPWVSISDMTRAGRFVRDTEKTLTHDGVNHSTAKIYPPGVVLYAMYASLGECAIAVGRVSSSQAILGIEPSQYIDRDYLYYYLASIKEQVRDMGQQGAQSNLNAGMVKDFRVYLPSMEEQQEIAGVLTNVDNEIDILFQRLTKARNIKQGMMQQFLTGRTRLPPKDSAA